MDGLNIWVHCYCTLFLYLQFKNYPYFLDLLEKFLCHKCQTVEFSDFIEGVNEMCQVQYGGATIYKSVMLFVSHIFNLLGFCF